MKLIYKILFILLSCSVINGQTITLYTMNLQHGQGTDANFNNQRQINQITDADCVAVQEKGTSDNGWNTGLTNAGMSQIVYRENSSLADGNAIWCKTATTTVHNVLSVLLSDGFTGTGGVDVDKSAVAADVTISGRRFTLVSTHFCWSACSEAQRISHANALLAWRTSSLPAGQDVVFLGDFNFPPSATSQYNLFTTDYVDLWIDGINKSIATANWANLDGNGAPDMVVNNDSPSHDTRRIDYGWLNKNPTTLNLLSISLPDTRAVCSVALTGSPLFCPDTNSAMRWGNSGDFGVRPTDHNIIKFVFSGTPRKCRFHTFPSCQ